jgi:hypothetical protein
VRESYIIPRAALILSADGLTVDLQVFYLNGSVELERGIHFSPELAYDRWTWIEEDHAYSAEKPVSEL